jgi:hypothetical protein
MRGTDNFEVHTARREFPRAGDERFVGHECSHVIAIGWAGVLDGELLTKAEQAGFDVLVTFDAKIQKQNQLAGETLRFT